MRTELETKMLRIGLRILATSINSDYVTATNNDYSRHFSSSAKQLLGVWRVALGLEAYNVMSDINEFERVAWRLAQEHVLTGDI